MNWLNGLAWFLAANQVCITLTGHHHNDILQDLRGLSGYVAQIANLRLIAAQL